MEEKIVVIKAMVNGTVVTLFYSGDRFEAWQTARICYDNILSIGETVAKKFTEKEIRAYEKN